MPTTYRPYDPDQLLLLPASLKEWLPEQHLAYFISDAVEALDLKAFHARYAGDGRRRQPFDPSMMVKVLVYAYASGVFSSRKIASRLEEDVAFRVLGAGNFPAHRTLREFRQLHLAEFSALFVQIVQLAREAGLVKLGRIGIDGTKIKANASKHKAMSYGRMLEQEARLKSEIAALLNQAEAQDAQEDAQYGDRRGDELPDELGRREQRLKIIQAAKARLQARQREQDQRDGRRMDDDGQTRGPGGRRCKRAFGVPEDQAQDNFTDPQSRIMKTADGFQQGYNAQAAVDEDSHLIVATGLTDCAADTHQLLPMIEATTRNVGAAPTMTLADSGYASEDNFAALEARQLPACVALAREGKTLRTIDPEQHPATQRMAERLATPQGKDHYRRRKFIPEPVFGWIKQALGFRRFSVRGREAVTGEWNLVCLALNLRRMQRLGWAPT
ncbi:IS1182 family transposase [Immundisolibacter sp.]|uniref:IS1182 family transposase n=1 Tax=Immundisolibacter sp. TaxID=1934948 RepID=UPI002B18F041|nr:IS1182 family transposase [Immundisolibacter sp.]MEA3221521.1 IS1182 family transposase ISKpn6 [Immundisolibacter sp.]